VNNKAAVPIHYFSDTGSTNNNRLGTLWFYNNSFYEEGGPFWRWFLFDTSGGGGGTPLEATEWPQIQVHNNALWMISPTKPYFFWNRMAEQFTTFGKNVINSNWGSNKMAGGDGTGWSPDVSKYAFQGAGNSKVVSGVSNLIGVTTAPFNLTTFAPNRSLIDAGANLPAGAPKLPVRFQYGPSAIPKDRSHPLTIGAME
jgi:hypothetical protein